ncbi:MAG: CPBP family intramembrane metalloprotease [Acidocella sp.]|nr:CPBP family intramembrane metalloprotease [Acidocella sp.]
MKKVFAGLLWAILFVALGGALMAGLADAVAAHPHLPLKLLVFMALLGGATGLDLFMLALCFALLPGARAAPDGVRHFGLAQGLWGMLGTALAMMAGAALAALPVLDLAFLRTLAQGGGAPNVTQPGYLVCAVLGSELMAALWLAWYLRYLGPRHTAHGVGWCPAPGAAYGVAALLALGLLAVVGAIYRFDPPDAAKLHDLPMYKLYAGPPLALAAMGVVTFLLAPVVEEISFRGLAFGGIASRLGTGWAVCLTTLIFAAVHAPEKIHYLPGFADVTLLALASCWLRLRYFSIKPGIFLHMAYNTGLILVSPLL